MSADRIFSNLRKKLEVGRRSKLVDLSDQGKRIMVVFEEKINDFFRIRAKGHFRGFDFYKTKHSKLGIFLRI